MEMCHILFDLYYMVVSALLYYYKLLFKAYSLVATNEQNVLKSKEKSIYINVTSDLFLVEPTNANALKNQRYYEHKLAKEVLASFHDEMSKVNGDILHTTSGDSDNLPASDAMRKRSAESGQYQRLCRGAQTQVSNCNRWN
jgi:hypothetical protein